MDYGSVSFFMTLKTLTHAAINVVSDSGFPFAIMISVASFICSIRSSTGIFRVSSIGITSFPGLCSGIGSLTIPHHHPNRKETNP